MAISLHMLKGIRVPVAYLDQMLTHVVSEVLHERDFLGEGTREDTHCVV